MSQQLNKSCFDVNLTNVESLVKQVAENPDQGKFTFSAKTQWEGGTINQTVVRGESVPADEPEALGGNDSAPNPVELLLAALSSCVSIGFVTTAAREGVEFDDLEIEVNGDLDLRGYLGLDADVRPGYHSLDYTVRVSSNEDPTRIEELFYSSIERSPLIDNLQNGLPVRPTLEVSGPQ